MSSRSFRLVLVPLLAVLAWGCLPKPDDGSSDDSDVDPETELAQRCASWQQSYCSVFAPCSGIAASDCLDRVSDVVCSGDAPLDDCLAELRQSSCATLPTGCDPLDVADTLEPFRACEDLKGSYCSRVAACDATVEKAACRREQDELLDCHRVYAFQKTRYADCIDAIEAAPCGAAGLPEICSGVLWLE